MTRVLILGGYGNFGSYIARSLAPEPCIQLLIAGRSRERANAFAASLNAANPAEGHAVDIASDMGAHLSNVGPDMVIREAARQVLESHHPVKVVADGQLLGVVDSPQVLEVVAGARLHPPEDVAVPSPRPPQPEPAAP